MSAQISKFRRIESDETHSVHKDYAFYDLEVPAENVVLVEKQLQWIGSLVTNLIGHTSELQKVNVYGKDSIDESVVQLNMAVV